MEAARSTSSDASGFSDAFRLGRENSLSRKSRSPTYSRKNAKEIESTVV